MKKGLYLIVLFSMFLKSADLEKLLADEYKTLYNTKMQKAFIQRRVESREWVSPIMLSYEKSWSTAIIGTSSPRTRYSISIDQPIFKSGGIYYSVKMANSRYRYNVTSIKKEFRNLAARAVELLYNIKLTKLRIEKLRLQLKNSDIEINKMQDLFNAGLTDSVEVDKSLAKRDEIEIDILSLQSNLENLRGEFKKLSYKNPDTLKPPKLRMIPKSKFLKRNLELELARTNILMAKYNAKIVKSKYLPTVTVGLRLTKTRPVEWGYRENAFSFNFKVSMPLSINKKDDLELAKLDKIISQLDLKTKLRTIKKDYYITAKKLKVLSRQISLANKEAKIYKRLLINTTKLFKAGQKSKSDVEVLKNSYKIKKLDSKIYEIEKQLELINLYAQIR